MAATRTTSDARAKLAELGIVSATVLTGSTTITIDLAAFDELVHWHRPHRATPLSHRDNTRVIDRPDDDGKP